MMMNDSMSGLKPFSITKIKPPRPRKPRAPNAEPKRHSIYWTYFAFIMESDGSTNKKMVVCRLCGQTYSYSGNTTNLKSHLSRFHQSEYSDLEMKNPKKGGSGGRSSIVQQVPSISVSQAQQSNSTANSGNNNVEITTVYVVPHPDTTASAILTWLLVDLMPIHSVTGDGFRRLLMSCNPNLDIPVPGDVAQGIIRLYDDELMKITEELKDISSMAVSVEMWNIAEHEHYITVRGFWINDNWEMKCKVIHTRPIDDPNDYEILATEIHQCLGTCEIMLSKIVCIIAAPNSMIEKAAIHNLGVPYIPCLAHTLNTTLKQAMENTSPLTGVISRLQSPHTDQNGDALGVSSGPVNIGRSWSSVFTLLVKNAEQATTLAEFMCQSSDFGVIKETVAFLQPFKLASDGMCSEKYPPASMLLPLLYRLIHLKADPSIGPLTKLLQSRVAASTKMYWENPQVAKILNTVSFFDPRFKTLPHLNPTQRQEVTQFVETEVASILDTIPEESEMSIVKETKNVDKSLMGSLLGGLFDEPGSFSQVNSQNTSRIQEEIDKYSLEQRLNTNCSPLEWWRVHGTNYPALAKVAKKYLAISCTSIPASWVLTDQGETISYKRAGLEPEYRDKLRFLHENMENIGSQ